MPLIPHTWTADYVEPDPVTEGQNTYRVTCSQCPAVATMTAPDPETAEYRAEMLPATCTP